jgi:hypothetical protein
MPVNEKGISLGSEKRAHRASFFASAGLRNRQPIAQIGLDMPYQPLVFSQTAQDFLYHVPFARDRSVPTMGQDDLG